MTAAQSKARRWFGLTAVDQKQEKEHSLERVKFLERATKNKRKRERGQGKCLGWKPYYRGGNKLSNCTGERKEKSGKSDEAWRKPDAGTCARAKEPDWGPCREVPVRPLRNITYGNLWKKKGSPPPGALCSTNGLRKLANKRTER